MRGIIAASLISFVAAGCAPYGGLVAPEPESEELEAIPDYFSPERLAAPLTARVSSPAPVGFDFLGIKSPAWDCDSMLRSLNTLPHAVPCGAFLDSTFGTSDVCLKRLLASGRCSSFRGHLAWTNHRSASAAALSGTARYLDALAVAFPSVVVFGSAICEANQTSAQSSAVNAALRPLMPHVAHLVDSGISGVDPSAIREMHGPKGLAPAVSLDGQSATDVDVESFKTHGELYALLWDRSFNCRFSDKDNRPPSKRTDCPNQDQFNLITRYWYPMPPWPPGPPRLGPGEIWKPMAENYGGCKGRMCRPVAILNRRWPSINILAMNGQKLISCPYGGTFGRNQSRYYCYLTAFQLGQLAERTAQSEFVFLDAPGYRVVINTYRRGGVMR